MGRSKVSNPVPQIRVHYHLGSQSVAHTHFKIATKKLKNKILDLKQDANEWSWREKDQIMNALSFSVVYICSLMATGKTKHSEKPTVALKKFLGYVEFMIKSPVSVSLWVSWDPFLMKCLLKPCCGFSLLPPFHSFSVTSWLLIVPSIRKVQQVHGCSKEITVVENQQLLMWRCCFWRLSSKCILVSYRHFQFSIKEHNGKQTYLEMHTHTNRLCAEVCFEKKGAKLLMSLLTICTSELNKLAVWNEQVFSSNYMFYSQCFVREWLVGW